MDPEDPYKGIEEWDPEKMIEPQDMANVKYVDYELDEAELKLKSKKKKWKMLWWSPKK